MEIETQGTPIQSFYAEQSIFITGGTGFMGKILIEKLSRSCPDISTIYLLIRSKKEKCPQSRLDEMFEKPLYDRVKKEVPNFRTKIVPIIGDLEIEDFKLSEDDENILIKQVSIIFHMAANVRFNENVKTATITNINSTDTILKLAKRMPNLKAFIHVSTAYANCYVEHIEERFYSYPINHKDLITLTRNFSENVIEEKISRIISRWPNIYAFTKAIAEGLLENESGDLPIGIFRPSIVLSTAKEPFAGWLDSMYGPLGVVVTSLHGFTRFHFCNGDFKSNIIPADFAVNALIVSAWDVFNQRRRGKDMLIYNFVSPVNGLTWNEYTYPLFDTNKIYPLRNAIYFPLIIYFRRKIPYRICVYLGHFLPALLMDAVNICINRKPRMWKLYKKIDKFCNAVSYFCSNEWSFSTNNVQAMWDHLSEEDRQLFEFDMIRFDWTKYVSDQYKGIRHYLLNEDDSTLEADRIKYKRFYWLHQMVKIIFASVVFWTIWIMFGKMFS